MPSDQNMASARPSAIRVLLRDHMVQLAAWVIAFEVVIFGVPLLDPAALAAVGLAGVEIPLVGVAAAAAFYGLGRIDDRNERRFWQTLGVGGLFWLATITLVAAFPRTGSGPVRDAMAAAGYLCASAAFLLAADRLPHLVRASESRLTIRWFNWSGLVLASLCWFAYVVVVPVVIDPASLAARLPAGPLIVVLQIIITARFASLAVECRSPRWAVLYGTIATAAGVALVTHVVGTLAAKGLVELPGGAWIAAIRGAAPLCLLVAFRLRHVEWHSTWPAATGGESARDGQPMTVAFRLMALAACFPLADVMLHEMGVVSPAVGAARRVVALGAMVLVGGVGVVAYRILERQQAAAARVRAALEQRLREAKKMEALGRMSSVLTHEFLNLLNAIGGYIDLTLDDLGTDDLHADNLRRAHDVVERTTIFTKRLLVLSRGQPFHQASIVLNRTVREWLPEIRALVRPPATVDEAIGSDDGRVAISADNLREVLMPLATNASEAMERGGRLTIETGWAELDAQEAIAGAVRPGRYGRIVVCDTGVGMPRDVMAHLYEPFFTTKATPRNRGLGLATAYVVVTQHGGAIAVTSDVGAGTTVEILIPAAP